jgi:hypothetical protein
MDPEASMFRRPYQPRPMMYAPAKTKVVSRPAFATRPRIVAKPLPKLATTVSEVIDLITPPRSSALAAHAEMPSENPETPCKGSSVLRKSERLLEKTKLGRDSSRVKIFETTVDNAARRSNPSQANALSLKMENPHLSLTAVYPNAMDPAIDPINRDTANSISDALSVNPLGEHPLSFHPGAALATFPTSHGSTTYHQPMLQPYLHYASFPAHHGAGTTTGPDPQPRRYGFYMYPYAQPSHGLHDSHFMMQPSQNGYYTSTQYVNQASVEDSRPGTTSTSASTFPAAVMANSSHRATSSASHVTDISATLTGHTSTQI